MDNHVLPCEACGYDLNGLGDAARILCPECGLEQPRRTTPPEWPKGWTALAWQSGVTVAMCNLCLLVLLILVAAAPPHAEDALLALAGLTFLSGPVVPIVSAVILSRRYGSGGVHWFIPLGWLTNLLIGVAYLMIAGMIGLLM